MQPNETITIDDRIAELEEAQMLVAAILAGEPADATDLERREMRTRLASLFERMRDRLAHRDVLRELAKRDAAPKEAVVVLEDSET